MCILAAAWAATRIAAGNQCYLGMGMDDNKGAVAILQWRASFLGEGILQEAAYDQALIAAERLERSGSVSASEWLDMVRQANAALLRQQG